MHALVTGASGAIGTALARRLAADGHRLTLAARRVDRMQRLADTLAHAVVVRSDLCEEGAAEALVDAAVAAQGPVDLLVNNAGVQYVEPLDGVSAARMERLYRVNLTAPLQLMNRVLPSMQDRGHGAVVNVASIAAVHPMPGSAHYSSSKAALASASEAARTELAGSGVHVLTVYPGPVRSEMHAAAVEAMGHDWTTRLVPTGEPDELAERVVRALEARRDRVVYPRAYLPGFWLPRVAGAILERFSPSVG